MPDLNYWERQLARTRTGRRSLLKAGAAGALGAAAISLVGCGGSDDGDAGNGEGNGLVTEPQDTTSQARRGGVMRYYANTDVPSWDPIGGRQSASAGIPTDAYIPLMRSKVGHLEQPSSAEVEPGAAESVEVQNGGLRYVFKLRANGGFDPRSPTNGRILDAEDVVFTWKRYEALSRNRANLARSANPNAPIESAEVIDSRTVAFNLANPDADFLVLLRGLVIQPREADGGFDPNAEMRGSGPWMVSDYRPSVSATFVPNPNFYAKDDFYFDSAEYPIIPETAAQLAQFRSGNIYLYQPNMLELLPTKREVPAIEMFHNPVVSTLNGLMPLGWLEGSPVRDVRVRQALRMAIDEQTFVDAFYEVERFRNEGLPIEYYFNSSWSTAAYTGWWLDPQSKEFGANAKYLKYNPDEAKKLLSAAGFANGVEIPALYFTSGQYGANFPKQIEVVLGMFREIGIQPRSQVLNYESEWIPQVFNGVGKFVGMSFTYRGDPAVTGLTNLFTRTGSRFYGFDVNGRDPSNGDPGLEDMIFKQKKELDGEARQEQVFEIQRYLAEKAYYPQFVPAWATTFSLNWPTLRNREVWREGYRFEKLWLDPSRPPLAS